MRKVKLEGHLGLLHEGKKKERKKSALLIKGNHLSFDRKMGNSPAPLNPGVPRAIAFTSTLSANGLSCR